MKISAVSVNLYTAFGNVENPSQSQNAGVIIKDKQLNSFTSSQKLASSKSELYDSINEWKAFCHKQIKENNKDFIV